LTNDAVRCHGVPPYRVVVVHGGPGAPGSMETVARELSSLTGVLEPIQTASSVDGQVEELARIIEDRGEKPVVLIGWSWGAWLSFLVASEHPDLVSKLILVGSGPFREEYATSIMPTRLRRLNRAERTELTMIMDRLDRPSGKGDDLMARLCTLISEADTYDQVEKGAGEECQFEIYRRVWGQASELRRSGSLLEAGGMIRCPVMAIHGDFDPHPYRGVMEPLSETLENFRFVLLKRCGHMPWVERHAREEFFTLLRSEIDRSSE